MKKNIDKRKALAVIVVAINGFSSIAPAVLPLANLPVCEGKLDNTWTAGISLGGQIVDYLFFTTAEAKATAVAIAGTDTKSYEYNIDALKASGASYLLKGALDPGAKLYNDFLTRKNGTIAYYDDVKGAYVDASVVNAAAKAALEAGKNFSLDETTSAATTSTIILNPVPVTVDATGSVVTGATNNPEPGGTVQNVSDGQSVNNYSITSGNTQIVSSGGVAIGSKVSSGGMLQVLSGGLASSGTAATDKLIVSSGGTLAISGGGTVSGATLNDGYVLQTDTNARLDANNGTVNIGIVTNSNNQSYITARGLTLNSGGRLTVLGGATAENTVVNSGGALVIETEGTVNNATLQEGYILQANTATHLDANNNSINIDYGSASGVTLNNRGKLTVLDGALAESTTINSAGTLEVLSGGRADRVQVNQGGILAVPSGGTATNVTLAQGYVLKTDTGAVLDANNGAVKISGGVANGVTLNSGGMLTVLANNTANFTTVNSAGALTVLPGGSANNTRVNSGGILNVSSGGTVNNSVFEAGYILNADTTVTIQALDTAGNILTIGGGTVSGTLTGGSATVTSGGSANSLTLQSGARVVVQNGGTINNTAVAGGTADLLSGSTAHNTIITNDGIQNVSSGAQTFNTQIYHCNENVYGTTTGTTIHSGGTQTVYNGGTANSTVVEQGGIQAIFSGGTASDSTINNGGMLILKAGSELNGTTTVNGGAYLENSGSYHINTLNANSAAVILGAPFDMSVGRQLNIGSLNGSARFMITTNLSGNTADTISIASGTSSNTVRVAFDPAYLTGLSTTGSATFATVSGGSAMFTAETNDFGAYRYTPTLASSTNAGITTWNVSKLTVGGSETVRTATDAAAAGLVSWRAANNHLIKRMGELRDASGEAGVWLRTYRGSQDISGNEGRRTNQQYIAMQGGYDHRNSRSDGDVYTGYAIDYLSGSDTFNRGTGNSRSLSLGVYGSYVDHKGQFIDLIAKVGKIHNDYTSYLNDNLNTKVNGDFDNWGTSLSAEYGFRKQLTNNWYVEPQAELTYNHINAAGYKTSDGVSVRNGAVSSLVGRLGLQAGRSMGVTHYYGRVSLLKEFSASSQTTAFSDNLSPVNLQQKFKDSWLEFSLGLTTKLNTRTNSYLEITRTTGGITRTPWQVNAGVRWNF